MMLGQPEQPPVGGGRQPSVEPLSQPHRGDVTDDPPVGVGHAGPSHRPPAALHGRPELTRGEDAIDVATWAGSVPAVSGIAPRVRLGRSRWFNLLWLLPIGFVVLIAGIALAKELRALPAVATFIDQHPGSVAPPNRQRGIPAWVGWQHFVNLFLLVFIIRSGVQIMTDHPRLYWTRHSTPGRDWFRFQHEVPADPLWTAKQDSVSLPGQVGLPGLRHSIGLARWWHLGIDTLWIFNGAIFYIMIFTTGHWQRLVPTSWDTIPNAASVAIQYLSLDWPADNGWVAYNSLQLLAYTVTVFVAGPLAIVTGLGMSPALSTRFRRISSVLSIQTARSLHFLVLVWFLGFIVIHVTLVFATTMRDNLDHMYAGRDDHSWSGFWVFAASMVIVIAGWVAATPFTLRHPRVVQRVGYALIGPLQRLFEHLDAKPGQYTEKDISPYLWHNGEIPRHRRVQDAVRKQLRRLPVADRRPRRQPRRAGLDRATRPAPPRADHPALLHPRLVRHREMGRSVHADHPRPGQTLPRGEVGGVLLPGRGPRRRHLLRRAPDRADEQPPHDAGL
jgi:thiosulfate reductase cytochrome b subunit